MAIATHPGTPAHDLLLALAKWEPGATAEDLARQALPWEARPYRNLVERASEKARKEEHERSVRAEVVRISRVLGRLAEAGLVEPARGIILDPLFSAAWEREGAAALDERRYRYARRAGELLIVGVEVASGSSRAVAMVEALRERGPLSVRDLAASSEGLTAGGEISGAWKGLYRQLCEAGVLVAPQVRRLTSEGRALAASTLGPGEPETGP